MLGMDRRAENKASPRRIAQRFVEARVKTGALALEQKLKNISRTADLAQQPNPRGAFGVLETATVETFERTDLKSDSAVMKLDGYPDEIPFVVAEFLWTF